MVSTASPATAAIQPVLDGADCLLLARTAGGKTEAAVLPLPSRMATEGWTGTSVLYVCPLRALLNTTVGNPDELLRWLQGAATDRPRRVVAPAEKADEFAEISLDHVGTVDNAPP